MTADNLKQQKKAVALNYVRGQEDAPRVSVKGEGDIAKRIIEKAREYNIPIQEDEALVSMLYGLDLNEMIPAELYGAVAEVFTFIYKMDEQSRHDRMN